jgi:hypothetical protein
MIKFQTASNWSVKWTVLVEIEKLTSIGCRRWSRHITCWSLTSYRISWNITHSPILTAIIRVAEP